MTTDQAQPATLAEALAHYGVAYLLTAGAETAPHAATVRPQLTEGELRIAAIGRHSRANVTARPNVALLWPAGDAGGYALIVDGRGTIVDGALRIAPTRAVLTRPGVATRSAPSGGCAADCVELSFDVPLSPAHGTASSA